MLRRRTTLGLTAALTLACTLGTAGTGCRRPYAGGSEGTPVACSNNFDDDTDGLTDCFDPDCTAFCAPPSDSGVGPECGDGLCSVGEGCVTCEDDCGACPPGCGDGTCSGSETCSSCDLDCGTCAAVCGDGACDPVEEDCVGCPLDCGTCPAGCPDGTCNGTETCTTCPADCGSCCGNGTCSGGETCSSCSTDCGPCCGNGSCSGGETCSTCSTDCGPCAPVCGDFSCTGTETCSTCPTDCGSCCGNGMCAGSETCSTCPADCGSCGGCGNGVCEVGETCSSCATDCSIFGSWAGGDTYYDLCTVATGASSCTDVVGGTTVAMADDTTSLVTIPFSFPFYGSSYTSVNVSSNGRLNFVTADAGFSNVCLSSSSPSNDIFVFWDDLNASTGGITYATSGVAPNRVFEVKWNVPHYGETGNVDVRALLHETTGLITVCYVDTTSTTASGTSATTGIHGTSFDYVQNSCNTTLSAGTVTYYMPN